MKSKNKLFPIYGKVVVVCNYAQSYCAPGEIDGQEGTILARSKGKNPVYTVLMDKSQTTYMLFHSDLKYLNRKEKNIYSEKSVKVKLDESGNSFVDGPTCKCLHCARTKQIRGVIARADVAELIFTVKWLFDELMNEGEELSHMGAILDGSWPSAVPQLEKALEKAKKHPNRKFDSGNSWDII